MHQVGLSLTAGTDVRTRAPFLVRLVDVPAHGEALLTFDVRIPGTYGFVIVHAVQISDNSPPDTFTFDPTPEDACAFRILNESSAPARYRRTLRDASGCRGWQADPLYARQGRLVEAEAPLQRAVPITSALAAEVPAEPHYQHALAAVYGNLAGVKMLLGRFAESEAAYRKELPARERARDESSERARLPAAREHLHQCWRTPDPAEPSRGGAALARRVRRRRSTECSNARRDTQPAGSIRATRCRTWPPRSTRWDAIARSSDCGRGPSPATTGTTRTCGGGMTTRGAEPECGDVPRCT